MKKFALISIFALASLVAQAEVLTLDSCLEGARQRNCTIKSALLEVQMAQQVKKQVFTKFFPQVELTAFGFYAIDPLVSIYIPGLMPTEDSRIALEYLLDDWQQSNPEISKYFEMLQWGVSAGASLVQPVLDRKSVV